MENIASILRGIRNHSLGWGLAALLLSTTGAAAQTITTSAVIANASDDTEEVVATGAIDFDSSDLELINEGAGDQIVGLRFANLNVPQGAVIVNAYVQFTCDETGTAATSLVFRGEASDNAATFTNVAFNVSARPKTVASASWTANPWNTLQEQGADQRTANLKTVVQEIVSRSGWQAGNALALYVTGSGKRVAESYEGASSGASGHSLLQVATLVVEYMMPTTLSVRVSNGNDDAEEKISSGAMDLSSSDLEMIDDGGAQYVGMRFGGVGIPRNAVITEAYVQFSTDEVNSEATSLLINGEAVDNSATYAATAFNISSRPRTAAGVSWTPAAWSTVSEISDIQRTPNIASVVQEIVNRSGWNAQNALSIIVSGTGKRVAKAYNLSATEAPLLVVKYYTTTPAVAPVGVFPVPKNAVWQYFDKGTDLGTAWKEPAFDASSWAFGPAQLGYGDGDEATIVGFGSNANSKYPTTYFRHAFDVQTLAGIDSLQISLMRDDGAVVYLNGQEVYRSNMPTGAVNFQTLASSNINGTPESTYEVAKIGVGSLRVGRNVLAVEIHQDVATSSDLSFNFALEPRRNDKKLIVSPSNWEYNDRGAALADWFTTTFADTTWKYGLSPLGYGNGGEKTVLSYGGNAASKYLATYFRKNFVVSDTAGYNSLLLRLKKDDGAVVYLNGVELLRDNMPFGAVTKDTRAVNYVEGSEEQAFTEYYIDKKLLKLGTNLVAVEVHQNTPTSTDLVFDMELVLREASATLSRLSTGATVVCEPSSSRSIGCFTSVVPTNQTQNFVFPSGTHTFQRLIKSDSDVYTGTTNRVPNGNDFTGYIPVNGSSTQGWLSINHENTPGGVSIVDLHFDNARKLWKVDTISKVDFSQVVQTVRNCSGGVTPWGTVITSEETFSTGDANVDGYQDVGWQVEIDPKTRKIRDFTGDGKPDKLWAMGRMSHENIAVAKDGRVAYEAEDGGTSGVYKFVPTTPGNLYDGTLYVLKRDAANSTTGTWVAVPNTTQADRNNTNSLAGSLGGTNWGGPEDVEIGPDGMVYFTAKGPGTVWRFKDDGMTVSKLEAWVTNQSYPVQTEAGVVGESWNTGNDNLAFDGDGNLWVLQDGGRDHIWVVRPSHTPANPRVELFATTPSGSEPTGITFSPDFRFLFISFQNPSNTNTASQRDAADSLVTFNSSTTVVVARKEELGAHAQAPVVNLGPDIKVCEGTPVVLRYSNPHAQNIWNTGATDTALVVKTSGTYILSAVGNNGLVGRDTIKVTIEPKPSFELGPNVSICRGSSYTFELNKSYSYIWDDKSTDRFRTVTKAGVYYVVASNGTGCYFADTVVVSYKPESVPDVGPNRTICRGGHVTLHPGPGFVSYEWSNGRTVASVDINKPGLYWVKVTSKDGCVAYDTVEVAYNPEPELGQDITICRGNSVVLNAGTGFEEYRWKNGETVPTIVVSEPGAYWVRTVDEHGCVAYDTTHVTLFEAPSVQLGRDTTICSGCSIMLDAGPGRSYRWSNGAVARQITVDAAGNYSVVVTNENGCTASDDINVSVSLPTGVQEIVAGEHASMRVFPNPFSTDLTVAMTLTKQVSLSVALFDMTGRRVATIAEGVYNAGNYTLPFSALSLPSAQGVYMLQVVVDGREIAHKLIRK